MNLRTYGQPPPSTQRPPGRDRWFSDAHRSDRPGLNFTSPHVISFNATQAEIARRAELADLVAQVEVEGIQHAAEMAYYRSKLPPPKPEPQPKRSARRVSLRSPEYGRLVDSIGAQVPRKRKPASAPDKRTARESYDSWARARSRAAGSPLTASTGDRLKDEYRHVSGAILNLQASGHPVPAKLAAHRDRLLAEQRRRLTTTTTRAGRR